MMEERTIRLQTLVSIGSLFTVLISCGTIVWKQGQIANTVEVLVRDVSELKLQGTPNFRIYQQLSDERMDNLRIEVKELKNAVQTIAQLRLDMVTLNEHLKIIDDKLDGVVTTLDAHTKGMK